MNYRFLVLAVLLVSTLHAERGRVRVQKRSTGVVTVVSDRGTLLRGVVTDDDNFEIEMQARFWTGMRNQGFNCIRLYTWWENVNVLDRIDKCVDEAAKAGMYCMIDLHHSDGPNHPADDIKRWKAFWQAVAPRYKDRTHVLYELQNEPGKYGYGTTPADQEFMYQFVRTLAPGTHLVMWSGARTVSPTSIYAAPGINYTNASIAWHQYGGIEAEEIRTKYPVIMTEFWDYQKTVTQGERLQYSWILWNQDIQNAGKVVVAPVPGWETYFSTKFRQLGISWPSDFASTRADRQHISVSNARMPPALTRSSRALRLSKMCLPGVSGDGISFSGRRIHRKERQ